MYESLPVFLFLSVMFIAVFSFVAIAAWSDNRRLEREAYYRSETLKKIVETQGEAATSALGFIREQERNAEKRHHEGRKLGGLITTAVGIGVMVFLRANKPDDSAYLLGLIPFLIGAALLLYSYVLAPKNRGLERAGSA